MYKEWLLFRTAQEGIDMGLYINSGNEAFKISVNDDIYIDQSGILTFTNDRIGKRKRYPCVSRPRRFGKSLTAEMLTAYYDRSCDSGFLFQGLEIAKDDSCAANLNQYDVFSVNIQQFLRGAGEPAQLVPYMESQLLQELQDMQFCDFAKDSFSASNLPMALASLFAREEREKKGYIFIIDEWDCIFREAPEDKQAQKAYLDFLRDLLKDRTYVKLAYMTGILPVKNMAIQRSWICILLSTSSMSFPWQSLKAWRNMLVFQRLT